MITLARVHAARNENDAAGALFREALAIHVRSGDEGSLSSAKTHRAYGSFLLGIGERDAAEKELVLARAAAAQHLPEGSAMLSAYDEALADTHRPK
jgi:Tfp pilus assembly protein PilF